MMIRKHDIVLLPVSTVPAKTIAVFGGDHSKHHCHTLGELHTWKMLSFSFRSCFTLPNTGSRGFKSGEYGGRKTSLAPVFSINRTTGATRWVNGRIVHNNNGVMIDTIMW